MNAPRLTQTPTSARVNVPLASSAVLVATASGGLGLLVQLFLKERGASVFLISVATSLGSVGVLAGSYFWGRLSDRAGRRVFLVLTAFGVAASIAVLVPLPGNSLIVATSFARAFMDIGFASMSLAMISAASAATTRARGMSYNSSARSLGYSLGALCAGVVLQGLGYRNGFLLMSALPAVAALLLLLRLPREPRPAPVSRQLAWHALREAGLVRLYCGTILRQFGTNGAFALLYIYMDDLGIQPILMGTVSSLNTLTQVVALVGFGWVADQIGRRKVFLLGFGLSALLPCILAFSTNVPMMALSYIVLGVAFSSLYIGSTAHIGDRVPMERQGTMLGLFEMARGFGGLLGPLLAGALVPLIGFRGMFLTMAGVSGVGFLFAMGERFPFPGRGPGAEKPPARSPVVDGGPT